MAAIYEFFKYILYYIAQVILFITTKNIIDRISNFDDHEWYMLPRIQTF